MDECKVLIVEDNKEFRSLLRTILEAIGIVDIEEADTIPLAMEKLETFCPDVITVDWRLGGYNGLDLVKKARSPESPNRFVNIIMMTGYSEPSLLTEARDAGVNDFLLKPVATKVLMEKVKMAAQRHRLFVEANTYFGPDRRRAKMAVDFEERRTCEPKYISPKKEAEE